MCFGRQNPCFPWGHGRRRDHKKICNILEYFVRNKSAGAGAGAGAAKGRAGAGNK